MLQAITVCGEASRGDVIMQCNVTWEFGYLRGREAVS